MMPNAMNTFPLAWLLCHIQRISPSCMNGLLSCLFRCSACRAFWTPGITWVAHPLNLEFLKLNHYLVSNHICKPITPKFSLSALSSDLCLLAINATGGFWACQPDSFIKKFSINHSPPGCSNYGRSLPRSIISSWSTKRRFSNSIILIAFFARIL